jgi:hypothetical protein
MHVGSAVFWQTQVPPVWAITVDLRGQRQLVRFMKTGTDIDGNYVGHCEEGGETGSDLREELGILPFLGLRRAASDQFQTRQRG